MKMLPPVVSMWDFGNEMLAPSICSNTVGSLNIKQVYEVAAETESVVNGNASLSYPVEELTNLVQYQ